MKPLTKHAVRDIQLAAMIVAIYGDSHERYGSPRVYALLKARGERVSKKRVARIMRERQLIGSMHARKAVSPIRYSRNILSRKFTKRTPNRAWVGDITYLRGTDGWLYLAVQIDLFSRAVVGWAISTEPSARLAVDALTMGLIDRRPPVGLVCHSDRGVQYSSAEYRAVLRAHGCKQSMSRVRNCTDNAVAESFFASLKRELASEIKGKPREAIREAVVRFIYEYNLVRPHSTVRDLAPLVFERRAAERTRR